MRDARRFEALAGPSMSVEEFAGEVPSVYQRLADFRRILGACESIQTARKEFERIFKTEAK